tara:strand:+ start:536 stop:715 length:180 start_codon:yes stop_codon:yes gene_type:complete
MNNVNPYFHRFFKLGNMEYNQRGDYDYQHQPHHRAAGRRTSWRIALGDTQMDQEGAAAR